MTSERLDEARRVAGFMRSGAEGYRQLEQRQHSDMGWLDYRPAFQFFRSTLPLE